MEEAFNDLGVATLRAPGTLSEEALREQLALIWKELSGPLSLQTLPAYAAGGGFPLGQIVGEIDKLLASAAPSAILLDDVDVSRPVPAAAQGLLSSLIAKRNVILLIGSHVDARTDWSVLTDRVLDLGPFTEADVRDCLLKSPRLSRLSVPQLDALLSKVCGGESSGLEPFRTFMRLRAIQ